MDLQEYTSLVGPFLKFIQILGQGSHGLAVQITDEDASLSTPVNYAMKIGYTKDCLVDDGSDFDYQKEYTIGKLMGQLGIGPEIYKVGCAMGSGYNYPYIIMELFEADCDIAVEYAVQMNDAQLLTYIYKECIYIIRSMINENHYFTDIKTGNFVIKNFRNSGLPRIKMIDFDEQYRLQPYDALSPVKKVLPTLLIIQIFFMNLGPIVASANLYLNTYIQIFSRYLKKYQRNYPIFKHFIDTNPVIKNRLEWYLQENVFKYVNKNIFKDSKGNMITDVSEQISCAIYEVYPDSVSNRFGRRPPKVVRAQTRLQASRRRPTKPIYVVEPPRTTSGRARTPFAPFAARERSPTRRFSTWRSHSVAKPTMQRLCLTFKNVPRFVDNPNNDKPTIYKTIDELLASTVNKITSF
jgi:hypothetical protein